MTKREALKMVYSAMTERFHGSSLKTVLLLWRLLEKDLNKVWERGGFAHCTKLNQLFIRELLRTGEFTEDEVRTRWTAIFISPHQYAQVRLDGHWMDVDVWAARYGVRLGGHAGW